MSTQTIVIGGKNKESVKKPIVFVSLIEIIDSRTVSIITDVLKPNQWKYIELICKNYGNGFDILFAYDDPLRREKGTLYLGFWNDGVVE